MKYLKKARGANGKPYMKALFSEFCKPEERDTIMVFNLSTEDKEDSLSLHNIYISYSDPTEYQFAIEVFGSYDHWKMISESVKMKPFVAKWREELEVKLRSEAIRETISKSKIEAGFAATKWIAEAGWKPKQRQTIAQKKRQEAVEQKIEHEVEDDLARMRKFKQRG